MKNNLLLSIIFMIGVISTFASCKSEQIYSPLVWVGGMLVLGILIMLGYVISKNKNDEIN